MPRSGTRSLLRIFGAGALAGLLTGVLLTLAVLRMAAWPAPTLDRTPSRGPDGPAVPEATIGRTAPDVPPPAVIGPEPSSPGELADRGLEIPVEGVERGDLRPSFSEKRGERRHEAIDILAPRNTPVRAVDDGTIARLFYSRAGGITIYQFDPTEQYCYYYAHLERYADGLREGARVRRGQTIGFVGTSGNAPPDTPHLHFAIFRLTAEKRWWEGTPIDPYEVLR